MPTISLRFILIIPLIGIVFGPLHLAYGVSFPVLSDKIALTQVKDNCCIPVLLVPMSSSGNNVYMAWTNNDTGHWNVFFAKSIDGGKSFKTMIISAPNKGKTVNQNTEINSSGENVYVTWWTNKTGILMPVIRASNDNGVTFGKIITLNSTMSMPPLR